MRVYIDFKSPAAYLALGPALALAEECHLTIEWKAFNSTQHAIPPLLDDEDKGQSHRRVRALARRDMHLHYAGVQGIPMNFPAVPGATDLALCVLELLPSERRLAFVRACFEAYWIAGSNLQDQDTLTDLLSRCGETLDLPPREQSAAQASAHTETAQTTDGVVDVPAFIVAKQIFIGREHLPWIRELCRDQVTT